METASDTSVPGRPDTAPQQNIEADAVLVTERACSENRLQRIAIRVAALVVCGCGLALPLWFGGVHPVTELSASLCVLFSALLLLLTVPAARTFPVGTPAIPVLWTTAALALWAGFQGSILQTVTAPHPILGEANLTFLWRNQLGYLVALAGFSALFFTTRYLCLRFAPQSSRKVLRLFLAVGTIVALVALAHWFVDNGKLFWTFAPESVFLSTRARWPFVNANHLGHFLLLPLFCGVGLLRKELSRIAEIIAAVDTSRRTALQDLINLKRFQRAATWLLLEFLTTVTIAVTIFASLSRSAIAAVGIGLVVFVILDLAAGRRGPHTSTSRSRRSRSHHYTRGQRIVLSLQSGGLVPRVLRGALLAASVIATVLFLNERGRELMIDRLDYALLASKDDIRWELYRSSAPLLFANDGVGVGNGGWERAFAPLVPPEVGGVHPGFLHSDPMQFLIEGGAPAALLIWLGLTSFLRRTLFSGGWRDPVLVSLCSGLIALLCASFWDFPFRIPGIVASVAIVLAILSSHREKLQAAQS